MVTIPSHPLAAQEQSLKVAIKPLTPFVIYGDNNQFSGFSIDLWTEIAQRMGVNYEYVPLKTVTEVLDVVQSNQVDLGIAGISITKDREQLLDFSQPMFNSGLKILVAAHQSDAGISILLQLLTPNLLVIFGILLVVVITVGHFVWFFERKNPAFRHTYFAGVGEGIWWAASSLLGGADKMPQSIAGRIGAIVWIITGIILISLFTANLTAQNTVQQLESNIRGLDDLPGKRIATVEGTTATRYLDDQQLVYTTVKTIEDAYELLIGKRTDAVIYDAPVLQYYANTTGKGLVTVVGSLFNRQDYGIALPTGSPNREQIDQALLSIIEDGTYETLYQRWFGTS
jgi:polar amino acid transport system substrate-binding protein